MEQNNRNNNLMQLFQELTFSPLTEELVKEIEKVLLSILDNNNKEIFSDPLLYNFLLLLKNKSEINFLLSYLIEEIEHKSLRIFYYSLIEKNENYDDILMELPRFTADQVTLPPPGSLGRAGRKVILPNHKVYHVNYRIDDKGQALEILDIKESVQASKAQFNTLNYSPLAQIYEQNLKENNNRNCIPENEL